jgi:uncharacterized protein YndB with AHSA1/START domain
MEISIEVIINAPVEKVWDAWISPEHITKWNFAIDEWCCPSAVLDFEQGGGFSYRMEAKDGSMGFDFEGKFMNIQTHKLISFKLEGDRLVRVKFRKTTNGTEITEIFEAEDENAAEQQKQGWLSILNNFKKYVENS